jgi:signal transduction histidine kinase
MHWREAADREIGVVLISNGEARRSIAAGSADLPQLPGSLLFDLGENRVLMRAEAGRWRFLRASETLPPGFRDEAGATEGMAVPIASGTAEGVAVFADVRTLSTDHLDVAPRVAHELAVRIQEATLFAAVEDHSMAKARVAVARDLHDSVVQFLAGLGFRLEALKRSAAAEGELAEGLAELKESVMTEQRQLRAFIRGLRTGKPVSLGDLSRDCVSLCQLLSRQWSIDCSCACKAGAGWVALRTQLDVQQLIREAVANAVRHGEATRVIVAITRDQGHLCLTVADNGRGFAPNPTTGEAIKPPASLNARVRDVRGELEVRSTAGETSVLIRLPMDEAA